MSHEEPLSFEVDRQVLRGHWHRPDGPSERGLVMLHGFSGYSIGPHRLFVSFARHAAQAGWHVLRFDFRGRGHSDGDALRAGIASMLKDTLTACTVFRSAGKLKHLGLLGLCSGAVVALSATHCIRPDFLILWSPEVPLQTKAHRTAWKQAWWRCLDYGRKLLTVRGWARLWHRDVHWTSVKRVLLEPLSAPVALEPSDASCLARAADELTRDSGSRSGRAAPVLLVFAEADEEASAAARFYSAALGSTQRPHRLARVERANHNFYSSASRETLAAISMRFLHDMYIDMPTPRH